jgi:DNA-binding NtrC family response regulator
MDPAVGSGTSRASLRGRHVVLVDDDRQLLEVLALILQDAGCIVTSFDRFQDAKKYLTSGSTPDILVTDVRLGAFNGLQLAVLSKLEHPAMTAVVMTGYDDPVLRRDAEQAGALYLLKPVNHDALIDALAAAVQPPDS